MRNATFQWCSASPYSFRVHEMPIRSKNCPPSVTVAPRSAAHGWSVAKSTRSSRYPTRLIRVEERCGLPSPNGVTTAPPSKLSTLTPREQQILRMIGRGMSRNEIAKELFRSSKTIDAHQQSIMKKLKIHDRVDLVRYAIREGLVEP